MWTCSYIFQITRMDWGYEAAKCMLCRWPSQSAVGPFGCQAGCETCLHGITGITHPTKGLPKSPKMSQEYSSQKKNSGPTRALHAITSCLKHLQTLWKAKNTKIISDRALNCRQMVLYPCRMNNWLTVTPFILFPISPPHRDK